jgi:hypothetical protein
MEETQVKKKGNPNFTKKEDFGLNDFNKVYSFVLTKTYEMYKPVDGDTGKKTVNPYPPIYKLPSEGRTIDDATGKNRMWRCVKGMDTIWVDEQDGIEVTTLDDLEDLVFNDGKLVVRGFEKNKLAALLNQDSYEGKKYRRNDIPSAFKLVDEDLEISKTLDSLDTEYEALKIAKECSDEEMLPFAHVLGINTGSSVNSIRKDFILKAKANPKYFVKYFVDPKNEIIYNIYKAMAENIISSSVVEGKLVWTESRKLIMDIPKGSDIKSDIAKLVMQGDATAVALVEQLKKM